MYVPLPSNSGVPCRDYRYHRVLGGFRRASAVAIWNCTSPLLAHNLFEHVHKPSGRPATAYDSLRYKLACTLNTRRISNLASIWFRQGARTGELLSRLLLASRGSSRLGISSYYIQYRDTLELLFLRILARRFFAMALKCEPPCRYHHSCFRHFHNIVFLLTHAMPPPASGSAEKDPFATVSCSLLIIFRYFVDKIRTASQFSRFCNL